MVLRSSTFESLVTISAAHALGLRRGLPSVALSHSYALPGRLLATRVDVQILSTQTSRRTSRTRRSLQWLWWTVLGPSPVLSSVGAPAHAGIAGVRFPTPIALPAMPTKVSPKCPCTSAASARFAACKKTLVATRANSSPGHSFRWGTLTQHSRVGRPSDAFPEPLSRRSETSDGAWFASTSTASCFWPSRPTKGSCVLKFRTNSSPGHSLRWETVSAVLTLYSAFAYRSLRGLTAHRGAAQ